MRERNSGREVVAMMAGGPYLDYLSMDWVLQVDFETWEVNFIPSNLYN
jgi:hypothetical protein